jgi:hypothetical protein
VTYTIKQLKRIEASGQLDGVPLEKELIAEVEHLRNVCAEAYQFAGAYGAPTNVLDNLSAASHGDVLPHKTFLPVSPR